MFVLAIACGYVLGTFPSADLAARLAVGRHADIRDMGTGNPGAANVNAELGRFWGGFVLVLDVAKAAIACALGRWLAGGPAASMAGTAAVVGHCFPMWNGFRGGKGVASAGGQIAVTFPVIVPIDALLVFLFRRLRSRVYGLICLGWVVGAAIWWAGHLWNAWGPRPSAATFFCALASSAVIVYRFRAAAQPVSADTASS